MRYPSPQLRFPAALVLHTFTQRTRPLRRLTFLLAAATTNQKWQAESAHLCRHPLTTYSSDEVPGRSFTLLQPGFEIDIFLLSTPPILLFIAFGRVIVLFAVSLVQPELGPFDRHRLPRSI